ncbi:MAG: tetratricopeptide repeat protein [Desulfobacterales bacterium]|nr:MAG: tetratricopeptide repeat protein [Desulfobacterales bacterium]
MKILKLGIYLTTLPLILCLLLPHQTMAQEDWFKKGLILIKEQQYHAAIKAFSTAIEMIPSDFEAYNYRGLARTYLADYEGAIVDYTMALQIRAEYAEAFNNRGFAWFRKGNLKQALDDFSRAIEIKPALLDAYNSKAWILATSSQETYRNSAEALALAKKAVEINAGIDSLDTLAAAYAADGQFDEAVATQKRVVHLLIQQERTDELSVYIDRLKIYKARRPLRIEYPSQNPPVEAEAFNLPSKPVVTQKPPPVVQTQNENPLTVTYPYTIQVSAYRDPVKSFRVATSLSAKGDPAFACPVNIPGKGSWNRVFVGSYRFLDEARESAVKLKKRKFSYIQVTRKPYAVQVGLVDSKTAVLEFITRLRTKGYTAYSLPDPNVPEKSRILTGAYESYDAARLLAEQLAKDGFTPRILPR